LPDVKAKVFFGGIDYKQHKDMLAKETPNVVIGTPGRILQLAKEKHLNLKCLKRFILDECDKVLETLGNPPCMLTANDAYFQRCVEMSKTSSR